VIEECTRKIATTRAEHIEMMAGAYLKATNIPPEEAVLVEEKDGQTWRWWFERRKPEVLRCSTVR
jgi:hypothetical protein